MLALLEPYLEWQPRYRDHEYAHTRPGTAARASHRAVLQGPTLPCTLLCNHNTGLSRTHKPLWPHWRPVVELYAGQELIQLCAEQELIQLCAEQELIQLYAEQELIQRIAYRMCVRSRR